MALTNNRRLHAVMESAANINGVTIGGFVSGTIFEGYENMVASPADGLTFPTVDRFTKVVRGTLTCQDWTEVLDVLAGTVGTYVFYQKESGAATYTKHTLTAPVIHSATINIPVRGMASATWSFQCRPAANTDDFSNMWTKLAAQEAPTPATSARTVNIEGGTHDGDTINHVTGLTININGGLAVAPGDGDLTNTAVDVIWGGSPVTGNLATQDYTMGQLLLANGLADLAITLTSAKGVADKTLTIHNCFFLSNDASPQAGPVYDGHNMPFVVSSGGGDTDYVLSSSTTSELVIHIG